MANKNIRKSSRYVAVDILDKVESKGAFSNLLLNQTIKQNKVNESEVGLLTELVYGVMQRKRALDYQLEPFLKKTKNLEGWVRQLLRVSLYQLDHLDRVPDHAVINEAVTIAKIRGHKGIAGLINGVLRNLQRHDRRPYTEIDNPTSRIAIQYSLPNWMVELFIEELGLEETEKLASSLLEKAKVSLRINTKKQSKREIIRQLKNEGFEVEESDLSSVGLISQAGLPAKSSLFRSGAITIQDETSMLVAPALEVAPHHHVLDACAAPGGKTTHIASYLNAAKGGKVTALDLHEHKVKLINENAKRQGVEDVVEAKAMDAREVTERFGKKVFDRILVDAPCSGLGLMRRKPDIRYTKTLKDVDNLKKVQLSILEAVCDSLKQNGQLLYSTCTITKKENEEVIDSFLKEHPEFDRMSVYIEGEKPIRSADGSVSVYPHQYDTDGFFICVLKKRTE